MISPNSFKGQRGTKVSYLTRISKSSKFTVSVFRFLLPVQEFNYDALVEGSIRNERKSFNELAVRGNRSPQLYRCRFEVHFQGKWTD